MQKKQTQHIDTCTRAHTNIHTHRHMLTLHWYFKIWVFIFSIAIFTMSFNVYLFLQCLIWFLGLQLDFLSFNHRVISINDWFHGCWYLCIKLFYFHLFLFFFFFLGWVFFCLCCITQNKGKLQQKKTSITRFMYTSNMHKQLFACLHHKIGIYYFFICEFAITNDINTHTQNIIYERRHKTCPNLKKYVEISLIAFSVTKNE